MFISLALLSKAFQGFSGIIFPSASGRRQILEPLKEALKGHVFKRKSHSRGFKGLIV